MMQLDQDHEVPAGIAGGQGRTAEDVEARCAGFAEFVGIVVFAAVVTLVIAALSSFVH